MIRVTPSLLAQLTGSTWADNHVILASGEARWFGALTSLSTGTISWSLGLPPLHTLGIRVTDQARLMTSTANDDGTITALDGVRYALRPDGRGYVICEPSDPPPPPPEPS